MVCYICSTFRACGRAAAHGSSRAVQGVRVVLLKGLAKAPEDRCPSATDFVEALVGARSDGAAPEVPPIHEQVPAAARWGLIA